MFSCYQNNYMINGRKTDDHISKRQQGVQTRSQNRTQLDKSI